MGTSGECGGTWELLRPAVPIILKIVVYRLGGGYKLDVLMAGLYLSIIFSPSNLRTVGWLAMKKNIPIFQPLGL